MNPFPHRRRLSALAAATGGLAWSVGALPLGAAPFLYSPGDLLLTFRQTGGASDLVVNLGKSSQFDGLPAGTTLPITNLPAAQVSAAFPGVNGLRWSVAAANRPPADPGFPLQTLWVTAPRTDVATTAAPWLRKGQFVQGNAGAQIDAVGVNAALTSSLLPGGPDNTATAVVLPVAASYAIGPVFGPEGNYVGTFQGRVENVTPDDFDADPTNVSRSDLYELLPGTSAAGTLNAPGRSLGFFELKPDGTLTFRTGSATPPVPTITGITHAGDTSRVSFQSAAGFNYRLRYTDAVGLATPLSSWATGASITGTGGPLTLENTSPDAARFFAIEARP